MTVAKRPSVAVVENFCPSTRPRPKDDSCTSLLPMKHPKRSSTGVGRWRCWIKPLGICAQKSALPASRGNLSCSTRFCRAKQRRGETQQSLDNSGGAVGGGGGAGLRRGRGGVGAGGGENATTKK